MFWHLDGISIGTGMVALLATLTAIRMARIFWANFSILRAYKFDQ